MSVVYQLTFFLALGLLAIVVAIFVFAVSQVGRATEMTSKEQQDILLKLKEAKQGQIEKLQKQIKEAREVGHLNEFKMLEELKNSRAEIAGFETELEHLKERITLIKRKGAVILPGAFFLTAIILNITASGLANVQNTVALLLWIISIGALVFGIFRVARTLGAIEEVTITSQEAIDKLPEAVKSALYTLETEKKPELTLFFKDEQPPFNIKAGEQKKIIFGLALSHREIARNPFVAFMAPKGFDFPGEPIAVQPKDWASIGGYITTAIYCSDCYKWMLEENTITIKAPSKKETYKLFYRLSCEGYTSDRQEFEVVVE